MSKRTQETKPAGAPVGSSPGPAPAAEPAARRWRPVVISLLLIAVTLALFAPAARYDFINCDDPDYITNNPDVLRGLTWEGVKWAFAAPHVGNWIPISWLTHMLDVQVFGKQAGGPHLVNAFIHALNAVLVFWLLRRMTGSLWRSAFVAALFALHPLRVESVAWVCERRDVLSAFFALLSLLFYAAYAQGRTADRTARALDRNYLLSLIFFLLGLMSKPMVVTVPFLMLLLDYWPLNRLPLDASEGTPSPAAAWWPRIREKIPFFALSAVFSVVTIWGQRELGAVPAFASLPVPVRMENALVSYARYLAKLVWPAKLALQYPYVGHWAFSQVLLSLLVLIGATAWAVRLRRKQPCVLMGWLWFLGALLPVIGLIQAGSQSMADRFTYLPSIGLFVILGWAVPELLPRTAEPSGGPRAVPARSALEQTKALGKPASPAAVQAAASRDGSRSGEDRAVPELLPRNTAARWVSGTLAALVLVACALRSRDQLATWQTSGTVFRQAIAATTGNSFAHGCLGSYLVQQGQVDAGIDQFKAGLAISPQEPGLLASLATVLADKKQQDAEAITLYEASLRAEPKRSDRRGKLAELLTRVGKTDQAVAQYRTMLQLKPSDADTHNKLGVALASQGKLDEAIAELQTAVQLAPGLPYAHCNLGNALAVQHKYAEAVREYSEALRLDPAYAFAHNNLAGALEALDRLPEAEQHYREAVRLQPAYADAHLNLGNLLARLQRRDEAVAELRTALRLKPDSLAAQQQLLKLGAEPAAHLP